MVCKHCNSEFNPRRNGKKQEFCPGGQCRREHDAKIRYVGAQVLRKNGEKKARKPRTNYRRNERELWGMGVL